MREVEPDRGDYHEVVGVHRDLKHRDELACEEEDEREREEQVSPVSPAKVGERGDENESEGKDDNQDVHDLIARIRRDGKRKRGDTCDQQFLWNPTKRGMR